MVVQIGCLQENGRSSLERNRSPVSSGRKEKTEALEPCLHSLPQKEKKLVEEIPAVQQKEKEKEKEKENASASSPASSSSSNSQDEGWGGGGSRSEGGGGGGNEALKSVKSVNKEEDMGGVSLCGGGGAVSTKRTEQEEPKEANDFQRHYFELAGKLVQLQV
jgi:hypothetical protein